MPSEAKLGGCKDVPPSPFKKLGQKRKDDENEDPNFCPPLKRHHSNSSNSPTSFSTSSSSYYSPSQMASFISSSPNPQKVDSPNSATSTPLKSPTPFSKKSVVLNRYLEESANLKEEEAPSDTDEEVIKTRSNGTEKELFSPSYLSKHDLSSNETLEIKPRLLALDDSEDESEVDEEESEEQIVEEFDPYLFIAQLPPRDENQDCQVVLPPKSLGQHKNTLVLDLDETLVHCGIEPLEGAEMEFPVEYQGQTFNIYVRKRPYLENFLQKVSQLFEIVVFTASQKIYADTLLDLLDPHHKYIQHRLFRDSCIFVAANYLKDLSVLGRDLSQVVIIDNSPQAFGYQLDNGIPIESWFGDEDDRELQKLLPFLEKLSAATDVRPLIREKYKLYQKVEQKKTQ
jgi:Dullard-like phosphatase family protein